jgi:hypothetical protein
MRPVRFRDTKGVDVVGAEQTDQHDDMALRLQLTVSAVASLAAGGRRHSKTQYPLHISLQWRFERQSALHVSYG